MSKHTHPEGAPEDERWEAEGGTLDDGATTGEDAATTARAEDRAKRWKDANAEHWHGSRPSEATKQRDADD
ncbi:hypothetical protein ACDF64_07650 [Agromyces sp. MMS24-JH15]|uniref:hypothetical protein n=1 Tax=Agromyces sp. MMS24-JH15 TaxID=3243765 RepID=UPI0037496917